MRGHELREALRGGRRVYGIAVEGYGQPRWPRTFAAAGLDFVFMDSEHAPNDRKTMAWAAQLYSALGVTPLLRIPEPSPYLAAMGVDLGAHGIIAPYIETVDEVKALVGAVKYRPLKGAALKRVLDTGEFPSEATAAYLPEFNPDAVLVIMIESPLGVANLPHLLAVGGVDAVLIGPHDFSISHGIPEQYDNSRFVSEVQRVIQVCRESHVGVGIHYVGDSLDEARTWFGWGFNMISHRADTLYVRSGILQEVGALRRALDGVAVAAEEDIPGHVI